ncbi:hypothetical protein ACBY01_13375 [Sphingomonas sp. ac-8]|uniref:hypothetical protein n=1 Tax=Sphingomonas sp. ac-8 TaxID=3242977 RepID=UPI003A8038D5
MLAAPLIALALQAAAPPAEAPTRWSILTEPCASARTRDEDIVVCARVAPTPRLPLPDERGPPDRPVASNPELTGIGALQASAPPCATLSGGCPSGIDLGSMGVALVRGVGKLIDPGSCCEEPGEATSVGLLVRDIGRGVKKIGRKKDKRERIPIPL